MPNANYVDEWRGLCIPLPAIYSLGDPYYPQTWRTKHAGRREKEKEAKKKGRFDACWHYPSVLSSFHGAHKANWIRTSTLHWILFTAGRASFITFFVLPPRNRTLHIWHTTHSNTHGRRNTLAQLHFHCGSRWQKPHNTCLLVVCACVWACACVCVCGMHARRMRRDEERGGDEFKPFACIM